MPTPDPEFEAGPTAPCADSTLSSCVERLFREHNESLLRFLRARLRSPQDAKEVAQEAYVQMLGLRDPSEVNFLQGYLFRIAANIATNRRKQRTNRLRIDELVFFENEEARSPEHASEAEQEVMLLERALAELPEICRQAFLLVTVEELSVTEASRRLGLHERTARRYVVRATEHCHRVVYEQDTDHGGSK